MSDWTVDTLKEHVDARLNDQDKFMLRITADQDKAVRAALAAADAANGKAEQAAEKRFDSVNEFRQTLSDQTATFIRTDQVNTIVNALNEKIDRAVATQRAAFLAIIILAVTTGISLAVAFLS